MATGLKFLGNQYGIITPNTSIDNAGGTATNIDIIIDLILDGVPSINSIILGSGQQNGLSRDYFNIEHRPDGDIHVESTSDGGNTKIVTPPPIGTRFELKVSLYDVSTGPFTFEVFIDGVSQGVPLSGQTDPITNAQIRRVGGEVDLINGNTKDETRMTLFSIRAVSNVYDYLWAVAASDTTTTGVQPVLADANGSSATIVCDYFATDGSQWITVGPGITVTQATLTPGGTISGTYADYATIPTTLTVSDGTNTITIPSPTIDDVNKTFSGTMPDLPTTGTASLVLFGNVTVELS